MSVERYEKILRQAVRIPFRPRLRLTTYCNRKCEYCFAVDYLSSDVAQREMSLDEVDEILTLCLRGGIHLVGWQGGEPLLHPQLAEIASLHRRYGVSAMVFTNGLVSREKLECLTGVASSVLVNINPPETYQGSEIDTLDKSIGFMVSQLGKDRVVLGVNVVEPGMNTDFFVNAIARYGLREARVDMTRPAPSNNNIHTRFANVADMFATLRETVSSAYSAGANMVHLDCPFPLCQLSSADREFAWEFFHDGIKYGRCRSGLDISPGMMVSSCFCSTPIRGVALGHLGDLWDGWLFIRSLENRLRWERSSRPECSTCPDHAAGVCQGGCLGYKIFAGDVVDDEAVAAYQVSESCATDHVLANAYRCLFTGRPAESQDLLCSLEDSAYPDGEIAFLQGLDGCLAGAFDDAEHHFLTSIQQSSFPAVAGFEAGAALQSAGAVEAAVRVMESALDRKHPVPRECYKLHNGLAALYRALGRSDAGARHAALACTMGPRGLKRSVPLV